MVKVEMKRPTLIFLNEFSLWFQNDKKICAMANSLDGALLLPFTLSRSHIINKG